MQKELSWLNGFVTNITKPEKVITGDKILFKSCITFETEDGQKAFFEIRKKVIETIAQNDIKVGSKVRIGYVFMGNEKGDKVYNNLYINHIEHVK